MGRSGSTASARARGCGGCWGSEAAAHRTAILCSLVQTCKHLHVNPFVYLRDVIERVSTLRRGWSWS